MTEAAKNPICGLFDEEHLKADLAYCIQSTVSEMFGKTVDPTFTVSSGPLTITNVDMFSSVGMTHERAISSLVICFPHETLAAILKDLYKKDLPKGDPGCAHGAGEITNVSALMFRDLLKKRGFSFKVALPNVAAGSSFRIPGSGWVLNVRFTGAVGHFDAHLVIQGNSLD